MRCCIIGGAGFIGRRLAERLIATGRDVVAIGRRLVLDTALPAGVDYVACNYTDRPRLREILSTCDEIIDLAYATVPQTSFADPLFDLQENLPPSIALLEEARTLSRLRRLLIVSSGGTVYGPVDHLPIVEETPLSPVSPYGITKMTIERYAMMYHRLHSLPVIIVRPANAYGAGQKPFTGQGFIATAMGHVLRGEEVIIFGENGTIRDYVHVKDIASGIVAALEKGECGVAYNIGSGVGHNNRQVLDILEPLALQNGYTIRIRTESARRFDVPANVLNFGRLLACSGWLPHVSFEEGIDEMWSEFLYAAK